MKAKRLDLRTIVKKWTPMCGERVKIFNLYLYTKDHNYFRRICVIGKGCNRDKKIFVYVWYFDIDIATCLDDLFLEKKIPSFVYKVSDFKKENRLFNKIIDSFDGVHYETC